MQVSDHFKMFVAYYVEGAILNGDPVSRQKYLQRYCVLENCNYDKLLENLSLLIDVLNEYKENRSKVSLKVAKYLVQFCYLPDNFLEVFPEILSAWERMAESYSSYMKNRGGDIFNDMPGGHLLKEKQTRYFIFDEYVGEAKLTPNRNSIINKYKKQFGIKKNSVIEEHPFYKDYLSKFNLGWEFVTPDDTDIFSSKDWDLLARLIFGSITTSYHLLLDENWKIHPTGNPKVHICITVSNEDREITKKLDDLWSFQIMSLFRSYIDEQIQLITVTTDDEFQELNKVREQQYERFKKAKYKLIDEIKESIEYN